MIDTLHVCGGAVTMREVFDRVTDERYYVATCERCGERASGDDEGAALGALVDGEEG